GQVGAAGETDQVVVAHGGAAAGTGQCRHGVLQDREAGMPGRPPERNAAGGVAVPGRPWPALPVASQAHQPSAGACSSRPGRGRGRARRAPARRPAMIGYQLTDEHEELRATVAEFARDVVAPVIGDYYERCEFPYDIVARMGKLGLFGLPFPEEYGGMGGGIFALCLATQGLARGDSPVAGPPGAGAAAVAPPPLPRWQPGR